ncbi:MAG: type III secretion protein [Duodenibacillus sp.]|nr:type III secretion protein [Duodenibacillus sp.]
MSDGLNINEAFNTIFQKIETQGKELKDSLNKLDGKELSDTDMLKMQFQVNTYNTMLEAASTVTKALVDEAKQLAQRSS